MAKKISGKSQEKAGGDTDRTGPKSRKAKQPPLDAEAIEEFAERFYQLMRQSHDNMREGARILRDCEPGTEIVPSSTNLMRMANLILSGSIEFMAKASKARAKQGRDPTRR